MSDFETFWKTYPKKKAKGQALKTWQKLEKSKSLPEISEMVKAIKDQITEKKHLQFNNQFVPDWKYPSTWLNGYCWTDDVDLPEIITRPVNSNPIENLERAYKVLCNSGYDGFREFCEDIKMSQDDIEAVANKYNCSFDPKELVRGIG